MTDNPISDGFGEWWNGTVDTPPMPEIGLYPTRAKTPRRIYYSASESAMRAAWEAGIAVGRRNAIADHDGVRVLVWLGYWRDEMPAEAVSQLQHICRAVAVLPPALVEEPE